MTPPKAITVLVPRLVPTLLLIEEIKIEDAGNDQMQCDGCAKEMGPDNPKAFVKTKERWWKLCNKCCKRQGFIR